MSPTLSPPNFSRKASARVQATAASPTTAAAGTAHTSLRSHTAGREARRVDLEGATGGAAACLLCVDEGAPLGGQRLVVDAHVRREDGGQLRVGRRAPHLPL